MSSSFSSRSSRANLLALCALGIVCGCALTRASKKSSVADVAGAHPPVHRAPPASPASERPPSQPQAKHAEPVGGAAATPSPPLVAERSDFAASGQDDAPPESPPTDANDTEGDELLAHADDVIFESQPSAPGDGAHSSATAGIAAPPGNVTAAPAPVASQPRVASAYLTTTRGQVKIRFREDAAPRHVENFRRLASSGFYNGLTFHRVVPGRIVFAGDPEATGLGGPKYTLATEAAGKHTRGAVGAVREPALLNPQKRSNGSQFYVCLSALPELDGEYTVFGDVVEGLEVLASLKSQPSREDGTLEPAGSGDKILKLEIVEE